MVGAICTMIRAWWWYWINTKYNCPTSVLSTVSQWPKNNVIQVEGILYDPCGGNPGPQYVLLSGQVVLGLDPLQVGQKAKTRQVSVSSPARPQQQQTAGKDQSGEKSS